MNLSSRINRIERLPLVVDPNEYNRFYLETKALKSGHLFSPDGKPRLLEQDDRTIVRGMDEEQRSALLDEQAGAQARVG